MFAFASNDFCCSLQIFSFVFLKNPAVRAKRSAKMQRNAGNCYRQLQFVFWIDCRIGWKGNKLRVLETSARSIKQNAVDFVECRNSSPDTENVGKHADNLRKNAEVSRNTAEGFGNGCRKNAKETENLLIMWQRFCRSKVGFLMEIDSKQTSKQAANTTDCRLCLRQGCLE